MNDRSDDALLLSRVRHIDDLCDRFELQWKSGIRPSIEALAAGIVGNERKRLLQELIALDVIYRRKQGETPSVGEYLERFEDLDGPPLVELINSLMAIHATKAVPPSIFFADWSFGTRESPATEIGLPRLR